MPQAVTIRSLPKAFEFVKAMRADGLERGEGYRGLGRDAIAGILQGQMAQAIDDHLDRMALLDEADRRNGSYRRHVLAEPAISSWRCRAPAGSRRSMWCAPMHGAPNKSTGRSFHALSSGCRWARSAPAFHPDHSRRAVGHRAAAACLPDRSSRPRRIPPDAGI